MTVLAFLAAVVIGVAVIARESRIFRQGRVSRAVPVQLVGPIGPRWWQNLLGTLACAAVLIVLGLAVVHRGMAPDTTPGPTTPLGGISAGTGPQTPAAVMHDPTSQTSTPTRGH